MQVRLDNIRGGSRLQKSELTPIDYLGLVQMALTSPQMGLISSEVEKKTVRSPSKLKIFGKKGHF